jgi:hypothetical protein
MESAAWTIAGARSWYCSVAYEAGGGGASLVDEAGWLGVLGCVTNRVLVVCKATARAFLTARTFTSKESTRARTQERKTSQRKGHRTSDDTVAHC